VGDNIDPANLPLSLTDANLHLATIPTGLSSDILLRRPDVMQAEDALEAAKGNAAAARAALFPKITLTGLLGTASSALASLFTDGTPGGRRDAELPHLQGRRRQGHRPSGRGPAGRLAGRLSQGGAIGLSDVANVLARRGTIADQLEASTAARDAAADNFRLSTQRYQGGIDTYLDVLTAQQTLYTSEKTLIATVLADGSNRVSLYRALGGDRLDGTAGPVQPRNGG
jgi:multidrug efflux system outer membrane protein